MKMHEPFGAIKRTRVHACARILKGRHRQVSEWILCEHERWIAFTARRTSGGNRPQSARGLAEVSLVMIF